MKRSFLFILLGFCAIQASAQTFTILPEYAMISGDSITVVATGGSTQKKAVLNTALPSVSVKTANYTMAATDRNIDGDATGGSFSILLPAVPQPNANYCVTKSDSSGNTVTVNGNGSNINGSSTLVLSSQYAGVCLYWTGSTWRLYPKP